jgi:hypothetical protein
MSRCTLSLVAGLVLGAVALSAGEPRPTNQATPNYYPIEAGNAWHYRLDVNGNEVEVVSRIAKIETIDGIAMGRLEASINGKIVATEHIQQGGRGVFRHRNNGQELEPALALLRYPIKAGDKWSGELKVGADTGTYTCETAEEEVTVTAGKFRTIRVTIKLTEKGKTVNTVYWFANNVGMVKQTVEADAINIRGQLERFEKKKK